MVVELEQKLILLEKTNKEQGKFNKEQEKLYKEQGRSLENFKKANKEQNKRLAIMEETINLGKKSNETLEKANIELLSKNSIFEERIQDLNNSLKNQKEKTQQLQNVIESYSGTRNDLEKQRDVCLNKLKVSEDKLQKCQQQLEKERQYNAKIKALGNKSVGNGSIDLNETVLCLKKELNEKENDIVTIKRDLEMKIIEIELKTAEEQYMKVRIDNLEAKLHEKEASYNELVKKNNSEKEQMIEISKICQQQQDIDNDEKMKKLSNSFQAEIQNLLQKINLLESKSTNENDIKTNQTFKERKDEKTEKEYKNIGTNTDGISKKKAIKLEQTFSEEKISEEKKDDCLIVSIPNFKKENKEAQDNGDDVWLFSLVSAEIYTFAKVLDYTVNDQIIIESIQSLNLILFEVLDNNIGGIFDLYEVDDLKKRLDKSKFGTYLYWIAVRDILCKLCDTNIQFVLHIDHEFDTSKTKLFQRQFVSVLAEAYDASEQPGKVVLGLVDNSLKTLKIPVEDATGQGKIANFYDITNFGTWKKQEEN